MGLIRSYTRLSDDELREINMMGSARDIADFVSSLREADPTISTDIDKAYQALELMFDRSAMPVNPVRGQGMAPGNIDFGEGIPNYMSPEYVVATRDILAHITFDTLLDDTTATELARQEVWPMMRHWDDGAVEHLGPIEELRRETDDRGALLAGREDAFELRRCAGPTGHRLLLAGGDLRSVLGGDGPRRITGHVAGEDHDSQRAVGARDGAASGV